MKIVQINSVLNLGSTGRIAEQIGQTAINRGHASHIAYGHRSQKSVSDTYKISGFTDSAIHGLVSSFLDGQGLGSQKATKRFVTWLDQIGPDALGLHNIHGYFLNYTVLFEYLRRTSVPVVWTFHDCWAFTGHCAYFGRFDCSKWQDQCFECPMTHYYPKSLKDNSRRNFDLKKKLFRGLDNLTIVTPSVWLKRHVENSFLSEYKVRVIHNGIDLEVFRPPQIVSDEVLVLGVSNAWSDSKGLDDFTKIRSLLPASFRIVLVGVSPSQNKKLPDGIEGIEKTESLAELVGWYQKASVFVNPTYNDNFPTTNIEALACGVPVVTYDTGGSPESLDEHTGRVLPPGDIRGLAESVKEFSLFDRHTISTACRERAEQHFERSDRFAEYIDLYESL